MKITDVQTVLLTGPSGNDPFLTAERKLRSASFIEIHTDTELVGVGETYSGYHAPELVPEIVEFFKPILVGLSEDDLDVRRLWERMYRCGNFWCRIGLGANVLAGIEGALWDLKGKLLNRPVYELLGGRRYDRLLAYATGGASAYPWDQLRRKLDLYRDAGFSAAKFGAGWYDAETGGAFDYHSSPQAWIDMECQKLDAIRAHVGGEFTVCLDGHMSNTEEDKKPWNLATATAVLRAMEPYDVFFYEEPLHYNDLDGYAALTRSTSVPVAGGECWTIREEFDRCAQLGAVDIAQPDASYIGIAAFVDVAHMFAARNRRSATHSWSSGGGAMENIHAAFASPNMAILELPPLAGPLHTEIWAPGLRFEDGHILPPQPPGLGVTLTDEIKNRFPFKRGSGEWNLVPGKPRWK